MLLRIRRWPSLERSIVHPRSAASAVIDASFSSSSGNTPFPRSFKLICSTIPLPTGITSIAWYPQSFRRVRAVSAKALSSGSPLSAVHANSPKTVCVTIKPAPTRRRLIVPIASRTSSVPAAWSSSTFVSTAMSTGSSTATLDEFARPLDKPLTVTVTELVRSGADFLSHYGAFSLGIVFLAHSVCGSTSHTLGTWLRPTLMARKFLVRGRRRFGAPLGGALGGALSLELPFE